MRHENVLRIFMQTLDISTKMPYIYFDFEIKKHVFIFSI